MKFKAEILTEMEIDKALKRLSHEIIENCDLDNTILVGIKTRGVPLAEILAANIKKFADTSVQVGKIDISLYRDDLTVVSDEAILNEEKLNFPIKDKDIILVDDVIYTGRTIRAAIEGIFKNGRPAHIKLACLVDRGHRELPIRGDFIGKNIPTSKHEQIVVNINSVDGKTNVELWDKE